MTRIIKFVSQQFQGIAGRSNIERPTSNNEFGQFKKKDCATRGASACAARANLSFSDRINRMNRIEKYESKINPVNPV
jgi:hypothetical protein